MSGRLEPAPGHAGRYIPSGRTAINAGQVADVWPALPGHAEFRAATGTGRPVGSAGQHCPSGIAPPTRRRAT